MLRNGVSPIQLSRIAGASPEVIANCYKHLTKDDAYSDMLGVHFPWGISLVETLYRGLADNSVGRVIEQILKADLILIDEIGFAPMDDTGAQLFFWLVAAAYERKPLGIGSHWPFKDWGRFLPEHTTAVSLLDRLLHHSVIVATTGESFRLKEARRRGGGPKLT